MTSITKTILFVIVITSLLFFVENKSNFPSWITIPYLTALITKYALGDWDVGYQMSSLDIAYWTTLFGVSYGTFLGLKHIFSS
jgi:hypothetical protein